MNPETQQSTFPTLMRGLLLLVASYSFAWGFFVYNFPDAFVTWIVPGDAPEASVERWNSFLGLYLMLVAVSLGYGAMYPLSRWYLIIGGTFLKALELLVIFLLLPVDWKHKPLQFYCLMNTLIGLIPLIIISIRIWKVKEEDEKSTAS